MKQNKRRLLASSVVLLLFAILCEAAAADDSRPADCSGRSTFSDNNLKQPSDIVSTVNAQVSFGPSGTQISPANPVVTIALVNPLADGTVKFDSTTVTITKVVSAAMVTNIGPQSPVPSQGLLPAAVPGGVHVSVPLKISCTSNAQSGEIVSFKTNGLGGDSFSPSSVVCNGSNAMPVTVTRDWNPPAPNPNNLGFTAAEAQRITITLVSSQGNCLIDVPLKH